MSQTMGRIGTNMKVEVEEVMETAVEQQEACMAGVYEFNARY